MARRKEQAAAIPIREQCPLFISFYGTTICCKGIIDGCESRLCFRSEEQAQQQNTIFCKQNYKRCEQYLAYQHFSWEDE